MFLKFIIIIELLNIILVLIYQNGCILNLIVQYHNSFFLPKENNEDSILINIYFHFVMNYFIIEFHTQGKHLNVKLFEIDNSRPFRFFLSQSKFILIFFFYWILDRLSTLWSDFLN